MTKWEFPGKTCKVLRKEKQSAAGNKQTENKTMRIRKDTADRTLKCENGGATQQTKSLGYGQVDSRPEFDP